MGAYILLHYYRLSISSDVRSQDFSFNSKVNQAAVQCFLVIFNGKNFIVFKKYLIVSEAIA